MTNKATYYEVYIFMSDVLMQIQQKFNKNKKQYTTTVQKHSRNQFFSNTLSIYIECAREESHGFTL